MSFTEHSVKLVVPTRKLVTEWSSVPGILGDRVLKAARVRLLLSEFRRGTYRTGSIDFSRRMYENGELRRVNGQHTLLMLQQLEDDELKKAKQLVSVYNTLDPKAETELHSSFDHPLSTRKRTDENRIASGQADPVFLNYPDRFRDRLIICMAFAESGFKPSTKSYTRHELVFLPHYVEFMRWVHLLVETKMGTALDTILRAWSSKALTITYFKYPMYREYAFNFWQGVIVGASNSEHPFAKAKQLILDSQYDTSSANKVRMQTFIETLVGLFLEYANEREGKVVSEFSSEEVI